MSTFQILLCTNSPKYILGESGEETLLPGTTWGFSGASGEIICGTVVQASAGLPNFTATTEYDGCGSCLEATLVSVSAGTPYEECLVCYTASGYTVTSVAVPHPVWTGLYGQSITQLNAVQLGGMNGLNS